MSFKCQKCDKQSNWMERVPIETREVEYYSAVLRKKGELKTRHKSFIFLYNRNEVKELLEITDAKGGSLWEFVQEKHTKGHETVREIEVCFECMKKLEEK